MVFLLDYGQPLILSKVHCILYNGDRGQRIFGFREYSTMSCRNLQYLFSIILNFHFSNSRVYSVTIINHSRYGNLKDFSSFTAELSGKHGPRRERSKDH